MTDRELAQKIYDYAGGKENITKAGHCVTRLRLYIKNPEKFDTKKINDELGLQVIVAGGQHQIIIGPSKVDRVYDKFIEISGLEGFEEDCEVDNNSSIADKGKEFKEKQNLFNSFIALISGIFQPILGILAGAGMIKGLNAILLAFGAYPQESSTYVIMDALGDAFFLALPVFVGYYAMKAFKATPMLGATLGVILITPAITGLGALEPIGVLFAGTFIETPYQATFFGIPIIVGIVGYSYSVIPIIAIAYIAAKIEKWSKKIYPDAVSLFLVPFTVILIAGLLGLLILGPIFGILTTIINETFLYLSEVVPLIYGLLLGGLWQVLVLFGLHWAIVPFSFLQLAELGAGTIDKLTLLSVVFGVSFATSGAVLGVMIIDKSKKTNAIGIPAFITGLFGITEPAIYGIAIPRKTPFIAGAIGGAISGAYAALTNTGTYTTGGLGLFGFASNINPNVQSFSQQYDLFNALIGAAIGFIVGLIVTLLLYKNKTKKQEKEGLLSPVKGAMVNLSEVSDKLFADEKIGKTIAIYPTEGKIYAPVDSEVVSLFPTKHAIGLRDSLGNEILIHIGIDTVNLAGEGFEAKVKQGDVVQKNQELIDFDIEKIKQEGYDPTVFIVLTTENNLTKVNSELVNKNDLIFKK